MQAVGQAESLEESRGFVGEDYQAETFDTDMSFTEYNVNSAVTYGVVSMSASRTGKNRRAG